jgi:regulator of nucleoside diphosphate kinase
MGFLIVSQRDFDLLEKLVDRLRTKDSMPSVANALERELDRAEIFDPRRLPADLVTMGAEVTVRDLETDAVEHLRVVLPAAAAPGKGAISVVAPLGLGLLGARVGEVVTWEMPGDARRLRIEHVGPASATAERRARENYSGSSRRSTSARFSRQSGMGPSKASVLLKSSTL